VNQIRLGDLQGVGTGLYRPECVLTTRDGTIYTSDWRGGVCVSTHGGRSELIKALNLDFEIRPNGIALMADHSFLMAHLGTDAGGLYRLNSDGYCEAVLEEIDGWRLPPSNFPYVDHQGRIWLTVSTRRKPRASAYRSDVTDGFIVLIDKRGARIVADDLGYTNECSIHPDGNRLYVNETFGRRLSCYDLAANGDLGNRQTVTEFGYGTFADGLAFDVEGGVWITSIVSNRIIRVDPAGNQQILLEDVDPKHLEIAEQAYQRGEMGRPHLDTVVSSRLKNISSLAFGGTDLKTAYLGCLLGDQVYTFRSPVAGWAPSHWNYSR